MAILKLPNQNLSFNLPEEGQLFTQKGDLGSICRRVGGQLMCSEVGTFVSPQQSEALKGRGGALQSAGLENLRQLGINVQSLPVYGDLQQAEREGILKFGGGLNFGNIKTPVAPGIGGEVFTKSISPVNPYGSVITSNIKGITSQSPSLEQARAMGLPPVSADINDVKSALDIISDPLTGKQYSRDLNVIGSTYAPYTPPKPSTISTSTITDPATPYDFKPYEPSPFNLPADFFTSAPIEPTAGERAQSEKIARVQSLREKLLGEEAYKIQQETVQGTPEMIKTRQELTNQINSLQKEAAAIPLQLQQEAAGRGITRTILDRQQTARLRDNTIQSLSVAAMLEAVNGNIATANDLVDRAVKAKFGVYKEEIAILLENLELASKDPNLTIAEKNRANTQIDLQKKKDFYLDLVMDNYKKIGDITVKAAENGANFTPTPEYPNLTVALQDINKSKTQEEALTKSIKAGLVQKAPELDFSIQEIGGRKVRYGFDKQGRKVSEVDLGAVTEKSVVDIRQEKNDLANLLGEVASYENREEALMELNKHQSSIVTLVGQEGYDKVKSEIDRLFPEEKEETPKTGTVGTIGSFFKRLFGR